jgi:hypothetical protein
MSAVLGTAAGNLLLQVRQLSAEDLLDVFEKSGGLKREGGRVRENEGGREGGRERARENAREEAPHAGGPELLVEIFEDDVIVPNHVHDGRGRRF